jgi:hypothetical protein
MAWADLLKWPLKTFLAKTFKDDKHGDHDAAKGRPLQLKHYGPTVQK